MMMTNGDEYVFVYSELFKAHEESVANKVGKHFICGRVFIGSTAKDFVKYVKKSNYLTMKGMYPDTVVIATGKLSDISFEKPKTMLNIDNH